jgi:hypothetical protein
VQVVNPQPYYGESGEPDYSITQPNFTYRAEYERLQDINYKDFVLHTFDKKNRHSICGQLHAGYWEEIEEGHAGMSSLRWERAYPLSTKDPTAQFALVYLSYFGVGGSSESDGYAQIWRLEDKKLTVVQQIQFNTHFAGKLNTFYFDADRQTLQVRASHYLRGDAHCCISAYDELAFRWEDDLFKLIKKETKPSHPDYSR